jgi:hypothetical protein
MSSLPIQIHTDLDLSEEQLKENYDAFIDFVSTSFSGDRKDKLLSLYTDDDYAFRLMTAPASGKQHFHYAHIGGYIQHIANVEKASRGTSKIYQAMGGTVDWDDEERAFAALHHDLGKLGNEDGPYYVPQRDNWHREKRGETFKHNPDVQFWNVTDNALYILQRRGIVVSWRETLAIKLSDGMYDDGNAFYYKTFNPDQCLRTNLPYIIHTADFLSCHAENDQWKRTQTKKK